MPIRPLRRLFSLTPLLLSAISLSAQLTTYIYQGRPFTTYAVEPTGVYQPPQPYATSDALSGQVTFFSPLPPNQTGSVNIAANIASYSFTDGSGAIFSSNLASSVFGGSVAPITTWTSSNSTMDSFFADTDANGQIIAWATQIIACCALTNPPPPPPPYPVQVAFEMATCGMSPAGYTPDACNPEDGAEALGTGGSVGEITFNNQGSWGAGFPLKITTTSIPGVAGGLAYSATITATGGSGGGYTWSLASGSLPPGFTLSAEESCGSLCTDVHLTSTGNPPAPANSYKFALQVTDSSGDISPPQPLMLVICGAQVFLVPNGPRIGASFVAPNLATPPSPPTTALIYAQTCGFSNFNWQQLITENPGESCVVNPTGCVRPIDTVVNAKNINTDENGSLEAGYGLIMGQIPPSYFDPMQGGYTYQTGFNPYPFYFQPGPNGSLTEANGSSDVSADGTTLYYHDRPAQKSLPGDPPSLHPLAGHYLAFRTSLVGVSSQPDQGGSLCDPTGAVTSLYCTPLYWWTWNTTYNGQACPGNIVQGQCQNGGVSVTGIDQTSDEYPIIPGSGTGGITITSINGVPTPTVTVTLSQATITWAQSLTATIQVSGAGGSPTATGSVILTGGGYTSAPVTLDGNGDANIVLPSGSLAVGSDPLTVTYTPDLASAATFSQAWGTTTLTVNPAVPQIVFAPAPASQTYGTPIPAGSLDAAAQYNSALVNGTFIYTTGDCSGAGQALTAGVTILQAGSYSITACFTPSNADFASTSATAQYSVTPAGQSISFAPITAQLLGATTSLSATATSGLPPAFQTLTPTVCSVSQASATMLNVGTCTLQATQIGNVDYNPANPVNMSFPVTYSVDLLYDPTRAVQGGSTFPLKIQLANATNADVSSSAVVVHATSLVQTSSNASQVLQASGNANPDNDFRFDPTLGPTGGYIFNLSTKGLATGAYTLFFTAGADPSSHVLSFQVR